VGMALGHSIGKERRNEAFGWCRKGSSLSPGCYGVRGCRPYETSEILDAKACMHVAVVYDILSLLEHVVYDSNTSC